MAYTTEPPECLEDSKIALIVHWHAPLFLTCGTLDAHIFEVDNSRAGCAFWNIEALFGLILCSCPLVCQKDRFLPLWLRLYWLSEFKIHVIPPPPLLFYPSFPLLLGPLCVFCTLNGPQPYFTWFLIRFHTVISWAVFLGKTDFLFRLYLSGCSTSIYSTILLYTIGIYDPL